MNKRELEILIKYSSRDVLVSDLNDRVLAELKCKRNSWLSSYYSGTSFINDNKYSITCDSDKITLTENDLDIGDVKMFVRDPFSRSARVEIKGEKFLLIRKNLKQAFDVVDSNNQNILTITGKLHKDKQKNLFGLIYFDNNLFHSVSMDREILDDKKTLQLLVTCGFCIRLFLEIDMGEYQAKIYR